MGKPSFIALCPTCAESAMSDIQALYKEIDRLHDLANKWASRAGEADGKWLSQIERAQSQLRQIAGLAKQTLDGKMADGEEWNTLNAIYWHAIDKAEPDELTKNSLNVCPKCGGPADNGHDREMPPNAYHCTRCDDRADARRYRWLKANHLQLGPDCWIRTGDDLDEAIDAEEKGNG